VKPLPAVDDWERVVALVRDAETFLLLAHVSPDGDALGSALAVGLAITALPGERNVQVSFGDDPFVVPSNLRHLPGQDLLVEPGDVVPPDLAISFDSSSPDRLGLLQDLAEAAPELVVVDHHSSFNGFGTLAIVDTSAPATAVIADELIARLGVEITPDIATCLYSGLVTDTGSFRYAGTTAATHAFAGRLLDTGIPFDEIARALFDDAPFEYLGMLGEALSSARLEPEVAGGGGMVWAVIPAEPRLARGLAFDLVEPIIDVVRKANEAEVAVVLKEDDAGVLRVSMRSKGAVDVSHAATMLGGGGHRYAAGFTATTRDPQVVMAQVREAIDDSLRPPIRVAGG
jgi:bifunctional oligoribonuclease and PAP phosphatase NrnA